ncbi:MAG TPA: hypothetical protein VGA22_08960 [Gemmatimonadales bacterium]|jgi:hypothetical protein
MECVSGRLLKGEAVVADNVEFWIARGNEGPADWNGTVELPPGAHVDADATYRVVLEDGRQGSVRVTNVGASDETPHTVGFRGAGPLG